MNNTALATIPSADVAPVDERDAAAEQSYAGTEFDLTTDGRFAGALLFALTALLGLALAMFAPLTPVIVGGGITAVFSGIAAFRVIAGSDRR